MLDVIKRIRSEMHGEERVRKRVRLRVQLRCFQRATPARSPGIAATIGRIPPGFALLRWTKYGCDTRVIKTLHDPIDAACARCLALRLRPHRERPLAQRMLTRETCAPASVLANDAVRVRIGPGSTECA